MLSIGEFSRVTQLSVKALRLYHEKGILVPGKVDIKSKYRYYRSADVEKGMMIQRLKRMGFSLEEIKNILRECSDDREMVELVEKKLQDIEGTLRKYGEMKQQLVMFLDSAEGEQGLNNEAFRVEREEIPDLWICGIRYTGKYSHVGRLFGVLFRKCGRWSAGKPFSLYYDGDYKEDGADIEACVPVKKEISIEGAECRRLTGGKAVTLIHRGPYEELGRSYSRIYGYCRENGIEPLLPVREQYIKAPGYIFRGNPKKYITKIYIFYHYKKEAG